jgi:hypothetical protein
MLLEPAMVTAYRNIGKQLYEACGESERAAYGKQLLHLYMISLLRNLEKVLQFQILGTCISFPNIQKSRRSA